MTQPPPLAYSSTPPPPRPPRPERPLRPAIWWSVGINVLYGVANAVLVILMMVLMLTVLSGWAGDERAFREQMTPDVVLLAVISFAGTAVIGSALTVGALLLLRLIAGYRTLPPFVQALLASFCAMVFTFVAGGVISALPVPFSFFGVHEIIALGR